MHKGNSRVYLTAVSTVLHLRGQQTVPQPVTIDVPRIPSSRDAFLCWNGEAWSLDARPIVGNDSEVAFRLLSHVSQSVHSDSPDADENAVASALASLRGPYAFAFFSPWKRRLYFGRDVLGRRSLLYSFTDSGDLLLSSISDAGGAGWKEVEADGIYWIDLDTFAVNKRCDVRGLPWSEVKQREATTSVGAPFIVETAVVN